MIEELLAAFADGGPDAGPDEIADILWLAARVDAAHRRPVPRLHGPGAHGRDAAARREGTRHGTPTMSTQPTDQLFPPAVRERSDGYGDGGPGAEDGLRGVPLRLARAEMLHEPLAVMRSLRRVGRHSDGGTGEELDEQLTVEQSIEQLMPSPVLRPARTRGSDLTLVVDAHHSMLLWDDLTEELRRAFTRSGVFRDVRTWFLTGTAAGGTPMVAHRREAAPRHPQELADPSGRRLILVCTDLVAGGWRESGVQSVLRQWGRHNAVAVLNVLPERLWTRGAVRPDTFAVRADQPAAAGRTWQLGATARRPHRRGKRAVAAAPAVAPVVSASPDSLARLAHLVSGDGRWWNMHCLRLDAAAPPEQPVAAPGPTAVGLDAVERFKAAASPTAQQLAAHLAAVPLTLPIMTLVRRSLLTDSDHGHLAEVALGGLLEPWSAQPVGTGPDDLHFDFLPGVREALLGSQLRGDVAAVRELVRRGVWEYIARSRSSGREFSATRVTGATVGSRRVDAGQQPFAERPALPVAAPPTDTEAASGFQGTGQSTDFEPSARLVALRTGHGSGMNSGAGVLLTPRLVLTCAHVVNAGTEMWAVGRDGREIACTTVWTGQGSLDAALVHAEESILEGEEWERLLPSRLRWGRLPDSGPIPVRVSGFGRSGEQRELLGTTLPKTRTITIELMAPFESGDLMGLSGALVSRDGFFVGTVARRHTQRPQIEAVSAAELLEDTGFRRALATHMTTPYEIEDLGGEPAPHPSPESPAVCLAIEIKEVSGDTDAPYTTPEARHDIRESLTAIMRRTGIDGVVTEVAGNGAAPDLLMMLDGPTAVQDVGRVLAELQTVVAGRPYMTVAVAVSLGEVTDTRLGLVGGAVSDAARLVGDPFLNAQLRQAARFVDSPVYLAVSDAMRDRIAVTLGPAWEDRLVPLGGRSEAEPGGGWLYEGPVEALGRAIGAAAAAEGGPTGPGPSWVRCGTGATAEDPDGCTGIKLPGCEKCLAHVSDSERAAFLATLAPGASVDFSGTTFTSQLLNEVVSAVREAEGGRVRLGRAIFNEAVLPGMPLQQALFDEASFKGATFGGRALFDEAVFRSGAHFGHATFLSSALFSGARFEGGASFEYATFVGDVDMGDLTAEGEVTYHHATFGGDATFQEAVFRGPLSFDYATFQRRSFFTRAEFGRRAAFEYATFQRRTGFDSVHFLERVSFDYSTFDDGLESLEALFEDRASFAYATFNGPVLLAGGKFRSTASFDFSTFLRPLLCRSLFFHGHAGFRRVTFREGAEFSDVTFMEGVELPGALVAGERTDLEVPPTEPEE
ncbi:SAV_2336 N-terminal domain-related protein [Streptomyces sp. NPDC097595]|uniref:SAV_2336 N-terminal domain-related protein n=1 Tax=Streptomyces sp. NPDC097595 TaxID=3366090 RepID=UPI003807BE7E